LDNYLEKKAKLKKGPTFVPEFATVGSSVYYRTAAKKTKCAYCLTEGCSQNVMICPQMNPQDYDALFNRGFTIDSGNLYLQDPYNSCCINRNIRMDVTGYKFSKKNKQDLKNWEEFLQGKRAIYEPPKSNSSAKKSSKIIPGIFKKILEDEINSQGFLEKLN
jgi:hypothetical protein